MVAKSEEKGLHLNSAKSVSIVFSKSITTSTCYIDVHGNILEQIQSFIIEEVCFPQMQDVKKRLEGELV